MKSYILLLLINLIAANANAQNFDEWFKQKKTQKKYLVQQIAALRIYSGYVRKGYSIARDGLDIISDFKNGEVGLHDSFFNSLKNVNPAVKNNRVADIIALQEKIIRLTKLTRKQIKESGQFNKGEIEYIKGVFKRLTDDWTEIVNRLTIVITNSKLEMKDDERLKQIETLYLAIQDNHTFLRSFSSETMLLAGARAKEKNDINTSRTLQPSANK
jgi:hypothetical protein